MVLHNIAASGECSLRAKNHVVAGGTGWLGWARAGVNLFALLVRCWRAVV